MSFVLDKDFCDKYNMLSATSASGLQSSENMLHLEQTLQIKNAQSSPSSSRILDIPCKVCGDFSSGKHYNIFACDGCAGFFKRSIRRNRIYVCKAKEEGRCLIDKPHRNQCRACRLRKCQEAGMNKDAVQHERGPRNSTLKRQQMSQYFQEEAAAVTRGRIMMPSPHHGGVLNLSLPRPDSTSPRLDTPFPLITPPQFMSTFIAALPLPPTPPVQLIPPALLSPAAICETAARLLFINVQWTKSIPAFTMLTPSDQLLLLEESWRELFIIAASKCLDGVNLSTLVPASNFMERQPDKSGTFLQEVKDFQAVLSKLNQFQLDVHELACVRTIVLFKTSFERRSSSSPSPTDRTLTDSARVSLIQDESQLTLNKYLRTAYPAQPLRFGKILMLLPTLRTISTETIEELFFRKAIANIPIVKIICDMYKSATSNGL